MSVNISAKADENLDAATSWQVKVLYDGDCPLCAREIRGLRRLDRRRGRLAFEDIAAPDFDAGRYGLDQDTVMARIHGVLPDGTVVEGLDLFRRAYEAVGLGWLLAPSRWPGTRRLFEAGYDWFARNRLRLTGRAGDDCSDGRCAVPPAGGGAPT